MTFLKRYGPLVLIVLVILGLILLGIYKQSLVTKISSLLVIENANHSGRTIDSLGSQFNYSKNGLGYQFTFIEFGAKGCRGCKEMESVMEDIKKEHGHSINTLFVNLQTDNGLRISKMYGIFMIPSQLILDREGKEIFRHTGVLDKNELISKMNQEPLIMTK